MLLLEECKVDREPFYLGVALAGVTVREPRWRRFVRCPVLVHERRHETGEGRGVDAVEHPCAQRLRYKQIVLVEDAREHLAALGELPRACVEQPTFGEDREYAVELLREGGVAMHHARLEVGDVAAHALRLPG